MPLPFHYPPSPHTIVDDSPPRRHHSPPSHGHCNHIPHLSPFTQQHLYDPRPLSHDIRQGTVFPPRSPRFGKRARDYEQAADLSLETRKMTSPTTARSPSNPSPTSTITSTWKMGSEAKLPFTKSPTRQIFVSSPTESPRSYQKTLPPVQRRQSRFDPMGRDEDVDVEDEGYGELGHHHPLRRVVEEDTKEPSRESVSLPGIKALLGGRDVPPTPTSGPIYASSPSLPSLIPASPSSPSTTARTSRYSSFTSNFSVSSETLQINAPQGWWAPEFERGSVSSTSSPLPPSSYRANSFPTHHYADEHTDKRRRSDGPPALRDAEESARLRWQAQGRVASYPTVGQPPLRSLLHPPPAASASMSRQSLSGQSSHGTPLTPFNEDGEYPFERRIAPVPSRSASIVGGQLAASFADLSASERDRRSPLPLGHASNSDMAPPMVVPERRPSALHLAFDAAPPAPSPRPLLPVSASTSRPPSTGPESSRRQSVTRPPSPDMQERPLLRRRSSLTEAIIAKSGDNVAIPSGRYTPRFDSPTSAGPSDRHGPPEHVQPGGVGPPPLITGWPVRRLSPESITPIAAPPSHMPDNEGTIPSLRGRARSKTRGKKRGVAPRDDEDIEMNGDPAMRGMEVLAESARRVSEAETKDDDLPTPRSAVGPTPAAEAPPPPPPAPTTAAPVATSTGGGGGGPKYVCTHCAKTFSRPSSLRIHTYSHTGERPFVCPEPNCQRRFSVQSNLKRHAKVHQAEANLVGPGSFGNSGGSTSSNSNNGGPGGVHPRPVDRSHRQTIQPPGVFLHAPPLGFTNANGHHPHNVPASFQPPYPPAHNRRQGQGQAGQTNQTQGQQGAQGVQQGHGNSSPSGSGSGGPGPWRTRAAPGEDGTSEDEGEEDEGEDEEGEEDELEEIDELDE